MDQPQVTKYTLFALQVCVPKDWTDKQVEEFANSKAPSGTSGGWKIRKEGDPNLQGDPERVVCSGPKAKEGRVHIMLDC